MLLKCITKVGLIISVALAMGGWKPITENGDKISESVSRGPGGTIHVRYLPDGTKCAVLTNVRAGGLDCDWAGDSEKRRYQERDPRQREEGSYYER